MVIVLGFSVSVLMFAASPVDASRGGPTTGDGIGYWTAQRVQNAIPRDVVLDPGSAAVSPRPKPTNPGKGNGGGGGGGSEDPEDPAPTGDVTGAPWPDGSTDPVDDIVGKVLFTLGSNDYVCSGSTVAPSSGSSAWVVLTAGHCTWDDGIGPATNWVFVPDYEDVLKFGCSSADNGGCYVAESLHPTVEWMKDGDDYTNDVAFANMAAGTVPPTLEGVTLPVVTTGPAIGESVIAFGYPAAKKYNGNDLIYCSGTATSGPSIYSANAQLECDMTGGSSGGPWYVDDGTGGRLAVSLNSFGLRGFNGYMFGPEFGPGAVSALVAAS